MLVERSLPTTQLQQKIASGNVVLIGMPGSGKSTMGRALSKAMKKKFYDSDEEVQKRTGVTIAHIFDVEGEQGFRDRETAMLQELTQQQNIILATGGGAVLASQNREILDQHAMIVYLNCSVDDLWQRTRHDRNRPLLQTDDPRQKLDMLFTQRHPLYQSIADAVVPSGRQGVHSLMRYLKSEIQYFFNRENHRALEQGDKP